MRVLVKGLAAAVLAAPLLSACVIYDSTAGENVSVNVTRNDAPPAEAIREARFADGALVVRVDSNGCTQASDFEVAVADNNPVEITLRRTSPDLCKALVPNGVELRWTYVDLGLDAGTPARILNPLK
ncbi:MAG: hypothetical protein P0Y50_08045 [Candidatus Brevundimonas colombiensis]|uniref:Lipoprotein n=1 Tax=Candidatus Brevundimonas colombiensis TaxID=3121376 RepID=A0AAJ5WWJ0_9CAUL|nr:hypothetical protein [Brevundimonas sp.]WEK38506.1 MAG: hypothetical protein P0Y50_08045 [Brevundimonas sp.]